VALNGRGQALPRLVALKIANRAYSGLASPLRDASGRSIKQQTNNKQS
jgi:hypothetical protein